VEARVDEVNAEDEAAWSDASEEEDKAAVELRHAMHIDEDDDGDEAGSSAHHAVLSRRSTASSRSMLHMDPMEKLDAVTRIQAQVRGEAVRKRSSLGVAVAPEADKPAAAPAVTEAVKPSFTAAEVQKMIDEAEAKGFAKALAQQNAVTEADAETARMKAEVEEEMQASTCASVEQSCTSAARAQSSCTSNAPRPLRRTLSAPRPAVRRAPRADAARASAPGPLVDEPAPTAARCAVLASTASISSAVRAKITESVRESTSCKSALSFPMTKQSSPNKKTTATLQSGLPPLVVEPISRRAAKPRATPSSKDAAGENSDYGYTSGGYSDYGHAYGTRV
jgi:hypothetical protein